MELNEEQRDVLTELISIGMGRAAGVMNRMFSSRVTLEVPTVEICDAQEIAAARNLKGDVSLVRMRFRGDFKGASHLNLARKVS